MLCDIVERACVPSVDAATTASPYIPEIKYARVISVYDGDTITVGHKSVSNTCCCCPCIFRSKIFKYKVRLNGIDSPELRSNHVDEKAVAYMAKKHLTSVISGKVVKLKVVGYDKYGRVLADVSYNSLNISEHMIDVGLAVEYDGKKKQEVDWMKLLLSKTESSKELGHLTIV